MNNVISHNVDVVANHITKQYIATILIMTSDGNYYTVTYQDANIANIVVSSHSDIERNHGKAIADTIGVDVANRYYHYDSVARRCCDSKNIAYDPFVELDEHHRFIRQMELLAM